MLFFGILTIAGLMLVITCFADYQNPITVLSIFILITALSFIVIKCDCSCLPLVLSVIVIAFCVYLALALALENPVISDFQQQYESAQEFVYGAESPYESEYYYQWGGQIGWSLVIALLLHVYDSVLVVKVFQCLCSALLLGVSFSIVKAIASGRTALYTCIVLALFPLFVLWNGVLSNQILSTLIVFVAFWNIIRPHTHLSLGGILKRLAASGALLAIANFIRPDAIVYLAALCASALFIGFFAGKRKNYLAVVGLRVLQTAAIGVAYVIIGFIISFFVSATLCSTGTGTHDTEWKFALGSDNAGAGGWNQEIVDRIEGYEESGLTHTEAERKVIQENTQSKLVSFETLIKKTKYLWWGNSLSFALLKQKDKAPDLYSWLNSVDKGFVFYFIVGTCCYCLRCIFATRRNYSNGSREFQVADNAALFLVVLFTLIAYVFIEVQPRYLYSCYVFMSLLAGIGIYSMGEHMQLVIRSALLPGSTAEGIEDAK